MFGVTELAITPDWEIARLKFCFLNYFGSSRKSADISEIIISI